MLNIYNQHVDNKDLQFNLMEKPVLRVSLGPKGVQAEIKKPGI